MGATGPTGFQAQFQEFMFYFGSIAQVLYWIVIPIIAIWAILILRRAVNHHTGKCCSKHAVHHGAVHAASHGTTQPSDGDDGWRYDEDDAEDDAEEPAGKRPIKTDKFVD
ncbi:MAG: hypothetical protein M1617_00970 [Actinobacteria bacterium]|nr:hypothetical protein [Actinomycetota bacterium]